MKNGNVKVDKNVSSPTNAKKVFYGTEFSPDQALS